MIRGLENARKVGKGRESPASWAGPAWEKGGGPGDEVLLQEPQAPAWVKRWGAGCGLSSSSHICETLVETWGEAAWGTYTDRLGGPTGLGGWALNAETPGPPLGSGTWGLRRCLPSP